MTKLGFINEVNGETFVIEIQGNRVMGFAKMQNGLLWWTPHLSGVDLNIATMVEEFPDLKDKPVKEIKKIAVERFYKHIERFKTEQELINYLKNDLYPHGYVLHDIQRAGFRPVKV